MTGERARARATGTAVAGLGGPAGRRVLVAFDKFRGTATASQLGDWVATVVRGYGCDPEVVALSDGGEGFREAFVGRVIAVEASDPWGERRLVPATLHRVGAARVGVVTTAEVVGRDRDPSREEALRASSRGVGELLVALSARGVSSVLLGAGGSATSDGGLGCYEALRDVGGLPVPVTVAADVVAPFLAARDFAHQKGVDPQDLVEVDRRLRDARERYRRECGVDVAVLARAGAAGGIAGALAALGARLTSGFDEVARATRLAARAARAALVVTGEGRLDESSLAGKVVGGVADVVDHADRLLVVCGSADRDARRDLEARHPGVRVISLEDRVGPRAARRDLREALTTVVAEELQRRGEGVSCAGPR